MLAHALDPELSTATYVGLAIAALFVGFVKTGLPPLGILLPVVFALALPTKISVGTLLLFLIVGDVLAVAFYRRAADWAELFRLVLPVAIGIAIGTLVLGALDDRALRLAIGGLVLALVLLELVRARRADHFNVRHPASRVAVGTTAGVATALANAAGPVMAIYFLSSGLDKARFMGTTAVFFLIVNVAKVPSFVALDMIQAPYLKAFALVCPLVVVGALVGRAFLKWIPEAAFRNAVLVLTALASATLLAL